MLFHFQNSGVLLDEVALALAERHYHELSLPKEKMTLVDKLIRQSRAKLDNYWERYEKLENGFEKAIDDNDKLRNENDKLKRDQRVLVAEFVFLSIVLIFLYTISLFR